MKKVHFTTLKKVDGLHNPLIFFLLLYPPQLSQTSEKTSQAGLPGPDADVDEVKVVFDQWGPLISDP